MTAGMGGKDVDTDNWLRARVDSGHIHLDEVGGTWYGPDDQWVYEDFAFDMRPLWEEEDEVMELLKITAEDERGCYLVTAYGMQTYDDHIEWDMIEWDEVTA